MSSLNHFVCFFLMYPAVGAAAFVIVLLGISHVDSMHAIFVIQLSALVYSA